MYIHQNTRIAEHVILFSSSFLENVENCLVNVEEYLKLEFLRKVGILGKCLQHSNLGLRKYICQI